jgi:hypothetical protein
MLFWCCDKQSETPTPTPTHKRHATPALAHTTPSRSGLFRTACTPASIQRNSLTRDRPDPTQSDSKPAFVSCGCRGRVRACCTCVSVVFWLAYLQPPCGPVGIYLPPCQWQMKKRHRCSPGHPRSYTGKFNNSRAPASDEQRRGS